MVSYTAPAIELACDSRLQKTERLDGQLRYT